MTLVTLADTGPNITSFGENWYKQTHMHPLAATLVSVASICILFLPRRWAFWPFIFIACFVASSQRVVMLGMDFDVLRLLVLAGALRVFAWGEVRSLRFHTLDALIIAFVIARTAIYTLQIGETWALVFESGQSFDAIGLYFLFRCLVRDPSDIQRAAVGFVVASIPVAICLAIEHQSGRNMFAFFGGVPKFTLIREDRMRCQGAFSHPILAGCFWACILPMVAALWWQRGWYRRIAVLGTGTFLTIVVFCASSTPVAGVMFAAIGALLFFVRRSLLTVRLGVIACLICLHMVMKAPVWNLIARITLAKGNTSYFRYALIDNFIRRFGEWALVGTPSTAHWFFGGEDVTNQYVLEGVRGGLLSLVLFVSIIWVAFRYVGRMRAACEGRQAALVLVWSLGVSLFVHCIQFLGVSYFGQTILVWFFTLAAIGSLYEGFIYGGRTVRKPRPAAPRPALRASASAPAGAAATPLPVPPPAASGPATG
jgi:hypothetical protein